VNIGTLRLRLRRLLVDFGKPLPPPTEFLTKAQAGPLIQKFLQPILSSQPNH
jgi:hypothetical protein